MKTTDKKNSRSSEDEPQEHSPSPKKKHVSQGHPTDEATGSATNTNEPSLRSSTTDSSRVPKNPNDDLPTGGNVR